jgi:hypothetical protein
MASKTVRAGDKSARLDPNTESSKKGNAMSNTIITAESIAQVAVDLLVRDASLVPTVTRVSQDNFSGTGGTTNIRVRRPIAAGVFSGSTSYTEVKELEVAVTPTHLYSAVKVTPQEATFDLISYANQVLNPQVAGITQAADQIIADELHSITESGDFDVSSYEAIRASLLAMRRVLVQNNVPEGQRYAAVSPEVFEYLAATPAFTEASKIGTAQGTTEAVLPMIAGLQIVETSALEDEIIVYGSSAVAFASLTPPLPEGGASAAVAVNQGVSIRIVNALDVSAISDVSIVDGWYGAAQIKDDVDDTPTQLRAVRYVIGS